MSNIKLLLFRRANRKLELHLSTNAINIVDIYSSEEEELLHHTSFIEENKYLDDTCGYYCEGVSGDILMVYVYNSKIWLRFNQSDYQLLDSNLSIKCNQLNDDNWTFECISKNKGFQFNYRPYVYAPWDDEEIIDVNFGLFVSRLLKDSQIRNNFIKRNNKN